MVGTRVWCLLPVERASLIERVRAAGALPILDLTCALEPSLVVSGGVAVRVVDTAMAPAGEGLVLARTGAALPGRPCWRELTAAGPVPEG